MPLGDWYNVPEVQAATGLSYSQVVNWARRHLRDASPPDWIQRGTKGIWVRADGVDVLRREHPLARGGGE